MNPPSVTTARTPRPRHVVRPVVLTLLKPVLRYSVSRDAWILRAVGQHHGPVLTAKR